MLCGLACGVGSRARFDVSTSFWVSDAWGALTSPEVCCAHYLMYARQLNITWEWDMSHSLNNASKLALRRSMLSACSCVSHLRRMLHVLLGVGGHHTRAILFGLVQPASVLAGSSMLASALDVYRLSFSSTLWAWGPIVLT